MITAYIVMFFIFSFVGWIFETVFCSLHDGFYQNRGFLFGPVCPIYGLGAMIVLLMADYAYSVGIWGDFAWWQLFLIGCVASAILEYSTHYFLEKKFHANWWDYHNMPLNLNGRICVPASTLFGISYVGIFKKIYPLFLKMKNGVPRNVMDTAALVMVVIFVVDIVVTVSTLSNFEKELKSMDDVVNTNMESLLKLLKEKRKENGVAISQEEADKVEAEVEKGKAKLMLDTIRRKVADMDAFRIDAINRVRSFNYPKLPKLNVNMLLQEIRERNPFYKKKATDESAEEMLAEYENEVAQKAESNAKEQK